MAYFDGPKWWVIPPPDYLIENVFTTGDTGGVWKMTMEYGIGEFNKAIDKIVHESVEVSPENQDRGMVIPED